jgi:uncharacterized caspase-like protein
MQFVLMVLLALGALLATAGAGAAETRVALVVGNSAYVNTAPLANPKNDAGDIAAALKGAGFEVIVALDTDRRAFDGALRSFTDKLAQADVALFFYAGHGLQVGAQNYLVPVDARLERERDLEFETVRLEFVMRQMEIDREGKTSIVILDACRDNPLSRNLARSMGTRSASIGRGLAAAATGLGTFIAYSTQPGNVALDGEGRNSPFTAALVKEMGVKGRNLPATMIEVRKGVVAATGGKQVPWDHSALTGDFYFVPGAAGAGGTVAPAGAGSAGDMAAMQARLNRLEEEARRRETQSPAVLGAEAIKLAELRARASSLDELVKDLQRKLLNARMEEGRSSDPGERAKLTRTSQNIQLEMTRRGLDLKRLREEIAALEGRLAPPALGASPVATSSLPVIPKASAAGTSPDFEVAENVGLVGSEIRSFKAPSPVACREACEGEAQCVGFQHGRKVANMGLCALFSRVDARREDSAWRSGLRKVSP